MDIQKLKGLENLLSHAVTGYMMEYGIRPEDVSQRAYVQLGLSLSATRKQMSALRQGNLYSYNRPEVSLRYKHSPKQVVHLERKSRLLQIMNVSVDHKIIILAKTIDSRFTYPPPIQDVAKTV